MNMWWKKLLKKLNKFSALCFQMRTVCPRERASVRPSHFRWRLSPEIAQRRKRWKKRLHNPVPSNVPCTKIFNIDSCSGLQRTPAEEITFETLKNAIGKSTLFICKALFISLQWWIDVLNVDVIYQSMTAGNKYKLLLYKVSVNFDLMFSLWGTRYIILLFVSL